MTFATTYPHCNIHLLHYPLVSWACSLDLLHVAMSLYNTCMYPGEWRPLGLAVDATAYLFGLCSWARTEANQFAQLTGILQRRHTRCELGEITWRWSVRVVHINFCNWFTLTTSASSNFQINGKYCLTKSLHCGDANGCTREGGRRLKEIHVYWHRRQQNRISMHLLVADWEKLTVLIAELRTD